MVDTIVVIDTFAAFATCVPRKSEPFQPQDRASYFVTSVVTGTVLSSSLGGAAEA